MVDRSLGKQDYEKRSSLARAKGLGSSQNGAKEWYRYQVLNFFVIFALSYLFAIIFFNAKSYSSLVHIINNPIHLTLLIISMLVITNASYYWIKEVIQDYVNSHAVSLILVILLKAILFFIAVVSTVSLLINKM